MARYKKWEYVSDEQYQKATEAFYNRVKQENALLKSNGYRFQKITGLEEVLLCDRGLREYAGGKFVLVNNSGKLVSRMEALQAIKEGREAEHYGKTLGEVYEQLLGVQGTEKQKVLAARIKLTALNVLEELKTVVTAHSIYHPEEKNKLKAIDALKEKVKQQMDTKQLLTLKTVLDGENMREKAMSLLKAMNFSGEKGKRFVDETLKIVTKQR